MRTHAERKIQRAALMGRVVAVGLNWAAPSGYAVHRAAMLSEFFCILALSRKENHVWTLENFNVIFGPFARRHSLWRRGNIARRHKLWRRGTCCAGATERRSANVAPSSAS
jgi:hypothetical protein